MARMSMPLFVDPQDVILRMQLSPDLTGIEDVVSSGIIAAQLHVERVIDGKLARQSQNCGFFIDAEVVLRHSPRWAVSAGSPQWAGATGCATGSHVVLWSGEWTVLGYLCSYQHRH